MSINWVMLAEGGGFTPLPGEATLHTSPPRTSFSLQSPNSYPGKYPYSLQCGSGTAYLTNRRVVYLPSNPTSNFQSFTAPLLHFHDTFVTAPFFGPNAWTAVLQPVRGGGIPAVQVAVDLKMTFKDGGAFDWHTAFERVKERAAQALEVARENGNSGASDPNNVHLDELPAYEPRPPPAAFQLDPDQATPETSSIGVIEMPTSMDDASLAANADDQESGGSEVAAPAGPPPEYEEVQRSSVADELEQRLRDDAAR